MATSSDPTGSSYDRIYAVVRKIPRGRVATYGQIATFAGLPGHARQVGYALAALAEDSGVPWHRVINARGEVSLRTGALDIERFQQALLEAEGMEFDHRNRLKLSRYQWRPRRRPS